MERNWLLAVDGTSARPTILRVQSAFKGRTLGVCSLISTGAPVIVNRMTLPHLRLGAA
jgi:hypothetical protein